MSEDYSDLRASLEWGANLELTPLQRSGLRKLCLVIAGVDQSSQLRAEVAKVDAAVPSWRLAQEAEKRRKAEARVAELELALKSSRQEWVFRRGRN